MLIKGGHLGTNPVVDVLVTPADVLTLRRARVSVARTHGTGCRHSAYLAAMLAHGMELPGACSRAQGLLAEELAIELGADR
ncbi:MAG: bifunctional hydroxymethylpyrimidine kinase/phosphomethylpyrimidine kinase [Acidobacteriota bacterium]